ncbi:MAG: hypothetical protein JWL77_5775 [Chthonomonadaceae bacterium]|nr:hypothetical protein [Chthonomonadaceae bacterium]
MRLSIAAFCLLLCVARATPLCADTYTADNIRHVDLVTHEIVYDPVSRKIWASTPAEAGRGGNSVVSIDPATGQIGQPIFVGSQPDHLAISDDGKFLYVTLASGDVRQVDLTTQKTVGRFEVGRSGQVAVIPGHNDLIAVGLGGGGVVLYSKGARLPGGGGPSSFAMTFGQHLYTYQAEISSWDFNTYAFGPEGLLPRSGTGGLISGNLNIRGDGNGRIYTNLGTVIDPEAQHVIAQMPDGSYDSVPVPDPKFNRVFFLNRDHIAADDYSTFVALDRLKLPGVPGATNLIRWGDDGFAFRTATQVCWLRSFIAGKPVTPADLSVSVSHTPQNVKAGSTFSCKVVAVNNGPGSTTGTNLTLTLPPGWGFVTAHSGSGRVTVKERIVDVDLGDMKPGDRVTLSVDVAPRSEARFFMTATIRADQWDNHPGNNIVDHVINLSAP